MERFRHMVTMRAISKHRDSLNKHRDGRAPIYRNKEEMKETWAAKGGRPDSQDWFRKGGATGVLKVLNTPQQSLKEKIERGLENVPGPKDQMDVERSARLKVMDILLGVRDVGK